MTAGIVSYATYLPTWRLDGTDIGARGDRVVAGFDEDSTTMAVAAADAALSGGDQVGGVYLVTSSPAYADKTNAVTVHTALGIESDVVAADLVGTGKSAVAGLTLAGHTSGLAVLSDVRVGLPGSLDEKSGGDGAAAFLFGTGQDKPVIAELIVAASRSIEILDRWRAPSSTTGERWEERLGQEIYEPAVRTVVAHALAQAGIEHVDHAVVASGNPSVVKRASRLVPAQRTTTSPVGYSGAADLGIALAAAFDVAEPGEVVVAVSVTDGVDVLVFRTTGAILDARQDVPVAESRAHGTRVDYPRYLQWRGLLSRESPRRPEPDRPAAPPSMRNVEWKFALTGTRCNACGFLHLPPMRICRSCGAGDLMARERVAGRGGRVATYTVDRLAYSPSPPVVGAVIDFDGGGRYTFEVADGAEGIEVGARVTTTFRRLYTAGSVHNYFWKARLLSTVDSGNGSGEDGGRSSGVGSRREEIPA